MVPSSKIYRFCYHLVKIAFFIFYRLNIFGKENIPNGAAVVCCNHSSMADPFLAALAFGIDHQIHIIAKAELFKIPLISWILRKVDMISVDRSILDMSTVKVTLGYLKNNERILIYP